MRLLAAGALLFWLIAGIAADPTTDAAPPVDLVRVVKSQHKLYLLSAGTVVASFDIALGGQPLGHKQQEGDGRTPEGRYVLDYKKADSGYYRAIHISYPDAADVARAQALGVPPGGAVMIHGQKNGFGWASRLTQRFDWTNGCVALRDEDMEIVWTRVAAGTPIELLP
ncbi:MAG: L,D-transpeptidase family protein [Solimonas sp.]